MNDLWDDNDSPERVNTSDAIRGCLRAVPAAIWVGVVLWTAFGIWMVTDEGIVYGVLFIIAGLLGAWDEVRKRTPTEQEELAAEEGLIPLRWERWAYIGALGAIAFYGLYVVRDESALLILFFTIHSFLKTAPDLAGEGDETRYETDDLQEQEPQRRSSGTVEGKRIGSTPVLNDEQTVGIAVVVGAVVYAVGWVVVIPNLFPSAERPSNSALTLVTGIVAFVAYGVTVRFIDGWVNVVVDQDRLENAEERRIFRLIERYWFQILVVLILALFVVSTEVLGLW